MFGASSPSGFFAFIENLYSRFESVMVVVVHDQISRAMGCTGFNVGGVAAVRRS
jgi:hypothetical protein